MKLKSPKLPPTAAELDFSLPSPAPSPSPRPSPRPCRGQSPIITTTPLLSTHHSLQLLPRPPLRGRQHNYYQRGRLKRDLSGTSTLIRRQGNPAPLLMTFSCNPPNQWSSHRFLTDVYLCIEDRSSNLSLDSYHFRGHPSRL
ncbi:hypothetical protein GJ744_000030 [Endocarpon pusillum]|uniref:Uncharacterized protein n=1 Tax=Endocarpon pusillum TaxID=364733 RepID=A0A8H7ARQ4_9EURO|nr:hypothetical protein GJ744_000030 [Endocarpon pusillum]